MMINLQKTENYEKKPKKQRRFLQFCGKQFNSAVTATHNFKKLPKSKFPPVHKKKTQNISRLLRTNSKSEKTRKMHS